MIQVTVHIRGVSKSVNRRPIIRDARFSNMDVACGISGLNVVIRRWFMQLIRFCPYLLPGARGGTVVEALRYKPEGRGFDLYHLYT
jgi:hypothetical protein